MAENLVKGQWPKSWTPYLDGYHHGARVWCHFEARCTPLPEGCPAIFESENALKEHMNEKHGKLGWRCPQRMRIVILKGQIPKLFTEVVSMLLQQHSLAHWNEKLS